MCRSSLAVITALGLVAAWSGTAAADDKFHPAPDMGTRFELKVDRYTDGVHGEMTVLVHNLGSHDDSFSARGMYFLPDDHADQQRLTVVGGIRAGSEDAPRTAVLVAAGATVRLRMDVYCIDYNRHAPETATQFTVASARLPDRLLAAIEAATVATVRTVRFKPDADQMTIIQGRVWAARESRRTRLRGD
jgi:hypothetical protein